MKDSTTLFFSNPSAFRKWLDKNHAIKTEQWVGFYKKASKIESITWSESVDEAICYGWIDGIRKSIDDKRYKIRFTPRKPNSIWSAVNIKKVNELTKANKMMPLGVKAFEKLKEKKSSVYAYEQDIVALSKPYEAEIKKNKKAWTYFNNLPPGYKKNTVYYVMSAKREATQLKRLQIVIDCSAKNEKIPILQRK